MKIAEVKRRYTSSVEASGICLKLSWDWFWKSDQQIINKFICSISFFIILFCFSCFHLREIVVTLYLRSFPLFSNLFHFFFNLSYAYAHCTIHQTHIRATNTPIYIRTTYTSSKPHLHAFGSACIILVSVFFCLSFCLSPRVSSWISILTVFVILRCHVASISCQTMAVKSEFSGCKKWVINIRPVFIRLTEMTYKLVWVLNRKEYSNTGSEVHTNLRRPYHHHHIDTVLSFSLYTKYIP